MYRLANFKHKALIKNEQASTKFKSWLCPFLVPRHHTISVHTDIWWLNNILQVNASLQSPVSVIFLLFQAFVIPQFLDAYHLKVM